MGLKNVRCCAPGFLGWKLVCEHVHRRQTAEEASVPSLFCPEGLLRIFLWPSDPRLLSNGNKQMWLNNGRALVWRHFCEGAERLKGKAGSAVHSPLPACQHPAALGDTEPPREGGPPSVVWLRQKTITPTELREEHRIWTISSSSSSLFCKYALGRNSSGISLHPEALSQREEKFRLT